MIEITVSLKQCIRIVSTNSNIEDSGALPFNLESF